MCDRDPRVGRFSATFRGGESDWTRQRTEIPVESRYQMQLERAATLPPLPPLSLSYRAEAEI